MAIVVVIVAFAFLALMLAKLFNGSVLGWIFGLSLMAGMALLPSAVIFYLGMRVDSHSARECGARCDAITNAVVQVDRGASTRATTRLPNRSVCRGARRCVRW